MANPPVLRDDPFSWVDHVLDGKYRIDSVVGEGGFGVVYRAHHLGFEQAVAVKCLKLKKHLDAEAHDAFLGRFVAEGRLLHKLSRATADVVQCLDVGVALSPNGTETPFLVLEWLDGTTLDRELRQRHTYTIDEAVALLEPAARGLAVAHEQNVSHRDVKPSNLMLTEVGGRMTLKVVDFGIAKAPDDDTTNHGPFDDNSVGMTAFTPRYGAPEQFSRKYGATGPWTDVYALALILVEVVTGRTALDGEDPVQIYVESSDVSRRPTLRNRGVDTSDAVDAVLLRALAVDPRARYKTCGEFWDALTDAISERPRTRSVRPPPIRTPQPERAPVFDRNAETINGGTGTITVMLREQKKRQAVWVGAVAATLILVVFAFLGMRDADKQTSALPSATTPASVAPPPSTTASVVSPPPSVKAPEGPPANMVFVTAGTFTMGSDRDAKSEKPAHPVSITRAFYIDRTEVTSEAYGSCVTAGACAATGLHITAAGGKTITAASATCNSVTDSNFARQPINCVTYDQAASYCRFVGKRLPTEAEWELAARGTDGRVYPWGNTIPSSCRQAIVGGLEGPCGSRKGTYEVATTVDGTSPAGAYDMVGNVWEWVADDYDAYPKERVVDPFLPPRTTKGIVRGGSWDYSGLGSKASARLPLERATALNNVGFRCAK